MKKEKLKRIQTKIIENIETFDGEYNKKKNRHIIRIDNKTIAELNDREYAQVMGNIVMGNVLPTHPSK